MLLPNSVGVIAPLVAATAQVIGAVVILVGAKDRLLSNSFAALAITMAAWNLCVGLQSIPGFNETHPAIVRFLYLGLLFLPATALHNAWAVCGHRPAWLNRAVLFAYLIACGFAALHATGLILDGFLRHSWGVIGRPGPFLPAFVVYLLGSVGLGGLLCVRVLRTGVTPELTLRVQYWLLGVSVALPCGLSNFLGSSPK